MVGRTLSPDAGFYEADFLKFLISFMMILDISVVYYYVVYNYILIFLVSNSNDGWKFTCSRLKFCL